MAVEPDVPPPARAAPPLHPLLVRITHWINAFAMLCMIMSGLQIYNASPLFAFRFPSWMTLGGWLAGALAWHFAIMWLLVGNGLVYLIHSLWTRRFHRHFLPITLGALWQTTREAFTFRLVHEEGVYNAVQRLLYFGAIALGILIVLTGLAIWKPVQFQLLTALFGGYDVARVLHFLCMAGLVLFLAIHLVLVAIVPRTLLSMIGARAQKPAPAKEVAS